MEFPKLAIRHCPVIYILRCLVKTVCFVASLFEVLYPLTVKGVSAMQELISLISAARGSIAGVSGDYPLVTVFTF